MQAVILAAGRGNRMGRITEDLPKCLLPIKGMAIIEYSLACLPLEISEILIIVGYQGEMIKSYLGNNYRNITIKYFFQKELDGTAGAVWQARSFLHDKFLVLDGDDLYDREDIKEIIQYDLAFLVYKAKNKSLLGTVTVDKKGNLKRIEKPKIDAEALITAGAYMLNQSLFFCQPVAISNSEYGLPQTIAQLALKQNVKVVKAKFWKSINTPSDLLEAENLKLNIY
jgi:NDP-sugar pyrophosphorylase family protein